MALCAIVDEIMGSKAYVAITYLIMVLHEWGGFEFSE